MATLKSVIWAWPIASKRMLSGFKSLECKPCQEPDGQISSRSQNTDELSAGDASIPARKIAQLSKIGRLLL